MALRLVERDPSHTKIDIVAIPAVGAYPFETWRYPGPKTKQPYESLWHGISDAAVYFFAFREIADGEKGSLEDYAWQLLRALKEHPTIGTRPIHFVGHSTGGLVLKRALVMAKSRIQVGPKSQFRHTVDWTFSTAFFSVPHYGSTILSEQLYQEPIGKVLALHFTPSDELRNEMNTKNRHNLEQYSREFAGIAFRLKRVWSFIEARETLLSVESGDHGIAPTLAQVKRPVVDARSAQLSTNDLNIGSELVVYVDAHHGNVARFGDQDNCIAFQYYMEGLHALLAGLSKERKPDTGWVEQRVVVPVKVHVFFDPPEPIEPGPAIAKAIKVFSRYTTLRTLLKLGPTGCIRQRLQGRPEPSAQEQGAAIPTQPGTQPLQRLVIPPPDADYTPIDDSGDEHFPFPVSDPTRSASAEAGPSSSVDQRDTYKLPDLLHSRFRWIHVPCNNMSFVPKVFQTIAEDLNEPTITSALLHEQVWSSKVHNARHGQPHGRFMYPTCRALLPQPGEAPPVFRKIAHLKSPIEDPQVVIYFPYLHWDTFGALQARNKLLEKRLALGLRSGTPPDEVSKGNALEPKLIWQYVDDLAGLPLHIRRSLDAYGHPYLATDDLAVRDKDQVLYKRTNPYRLEFRKKRLRQTLRPELRQSQSRPRGKSTDRELLDFAVQDSKVLMVDQLWLWVLNKETVVTFFNPREEDGDDSPLKIADLHDALYTDVNGDPAFATPCENCLDFAALAVWHAARVFLLQKEKDLQFFRIFEEYIGVLAEQQTDSYKKFLKYQKESDLAARSAKKPMDNSDDFTALLEIRDIRDELCIMDKLFSEQKYAVEQMIEEFREIESFTGKHSAGVDWLSDLTKMILANRKVVEGMLKNVATVEDAYKFLLNSKQKQANVAEALLSRFSAKQQAEQNKSVLVFTVITVIFLPLSFFSSLFGMNAKEWSGEKHNIALKTILIISLSISAAVVIFATTVAFKRSTTQWVMKRAKKMSPDKLAELLHASTEKEETSESSEEDTESDRGRSREPKDVRALQKLLAWRRRPRKSPQDEMESGKVKHHSAANWFRSKPDIGHKIALTNLGMNGKPKSNVD